MEQPVRERCELLQDHQPDLYGSHRVSDGGDQEYNLIPGGGRLAATSSSPVRNQPQRSRDAALQSHSLEHAVRHPRHPPPCPLDPRDRHHAGPLDRVGLLIAKPDPAPQPDGGRPDHDESDAAGAVRPLGLDEDVAEAGGGDENQGPAHEW